MMAKEMRSLDVSDSPELLSVAAEVARTGVPRVLRRDSEDLAIVRPVRPAAKKRARTATVPAENAWLESMVGIAESDGPSDVSANVHTSIADFRQYGWTLLANV